MSEVPALMIRKSLWAERKKVFYLKKMLQYVDGWQKMIKCPLRELIFNQSAEMFRFIKSQLCIYLHIINSVKENDCLMLHPLNGLFHQAHFVLLGFLWCVCILQCNCKGSQNHKCYVQTTDALLYCKYAHTKSAQNVMRDK